MVWEVPCSIRLTIAIILFYKSVERTPLLADDNTEFARAVVTETSGENLPGCRWRGQTARRLLCL